MNRKIVVETVKVALWTAFWALAGMGLFIWVTSKEVWKVVAW